MISIGLDIGSTTIKAIALDEKHNIVFAKYERHNAQIREKILLFLENIQECHHPDYVKLTITGSIGMGFAENYGYPFIQEVVAATKYVAGRHPEVKTMIDIGGEDAKVVFFRENEATDLRMNGNCAGGTGSFIDQMAILLGISNNELNNLALQAKRIYPIASRCGVFCKTDIQNLIAKNIDSTDISASIFHAVAVQTVMTLSHGCEITPPIMFCGGPLTFLPALRNAFKTYLQINDDDIVLTENSHLIPAWGAALYGLQTKEPPVELHNVITIFKTENHFKYTGAKNLQPLFNSKEQLESWKEDKQIHKVKTAEFIEGRQGVFLGIDSGSTTTKIIVITEKKEVLFNYYRSNNGNPINTVREGLKELQQKCLKHHTQLVIKGSCSTGYGEELIKTAFHLGDGVIETIAHFLAA
ncbi:MAG TPA: 2-hydroxyglutaryl-CoA dehydratase, partial [Prevotellaceae bacterium]|nr:2-hydroxyglutaryl-CoA dehydratase [Prevotellaceae bacterium]